MPRLLAVLLFALPSPGVAGDGPPAPGHSKLMAMAERAGLRPGVLGRALRAHARALSQGWTSVQLLTVIDYSRPSRERRLWVLDLARDSVLVHALVAHGRGSGEDLARRFSNRPGSLQSSLGTFITGRPYVGRHGLALRLRGVDPGLNDQAEARAIVVHGADYVSEEVVRRLGRLGRSQGCPALEPGVARRVIELIRDGTVMFAYYPAAALSGTRSPGERLTPGRRTSGPSTAAGLPTHGGS